MPQCDDRTAIRAGNGTRTRDPNLGKVVLYQLSYSRDNPVVGRDRRRGIHSRARPDDGGEGNRTPDLVNAIHALSQLSYAPVGGVRHQQRRRHQEREC